MTTKITIRAASTNYAFAPIGDGSLTLTPKQQLAAAENRCTHVLRIDGRRPVALVEEAETAGYVVHILGATQPHAAGETGATTLGLTPIVIPAERALAVPKPAAAAVNRAPAPVATIVVAAPVPATPAPARRMPAAPVRWAEGDRICLTEASTIAGHEDRRGQIATVRSCRPSRTRSGEYSIKLVWDNGRGGVQPWWAGHFELAVARMAAGQDEPEEDNEDDDEEENY